MHGEETRTGMVIVTMIPEAMPLALLYFLSRLIIIFSLLNKDNTSIMHYLYFIIPNITGAWVMQVH